MQAGFAAPCAPRHLLRNAPPAHRQVARRRRGVCAAATLAPGTKVVVSGGTGFVGRALVARLLRESADVVLLARDAPAARRSLRGTPVRIVAYDAAASPLAPEVAAEVAAADAVVNLAGEPVDQGRWTPQRKALLWESRVVGTAMLARAAAKSGDFRGAFVTASAVGFYGTSETETFAEEAAAGDDFLGGLARAWENAAWRHTRAAPHVRTVVLRIGVVLGEGGGALQKMKQAFNLFLGGPPGSGKQVRAAGRLRRPCLVDDVVRAFVALTRPSLCPVAQQWFSFVHREDLIDLIVESIADDKWSGTYNVTAPNPVRLGDFCEELARILSRPNWLPVPAIAVRAAVGSEAASLILAGQRVDSARAQANGFHFRYGNVTAALESILLDAPAPAGGRR
jgi:uncharacterized protein